MHKVKLLSAALLTAATFATPVLAAGHASRHLVTDTHGRDFDEDLSDQPAFDAEQPRGTRLPRLVLRRRLRDRTVDRCGALRAHHGLLIRSLTTEQRNKPGWRDILPARFLLPRAKTLVV